MTMCGLTRIVVVVRFASLLVIAAAILCSCVGHTGGRDSSAIERMMNPEASFNSRMAAMREAGDTAPDDPDRIRALKSMISAPRLRLELRIAALDELMTHDRDATISMLKYRLPSLPAADFIEHVCAMIVDEGWIDLTPSLVRSLARSSTIYPFEDRPERLALLDLHPDTRLADIVFDVAITPSADPAIENWRIVAWELLNTVEEQDTIRAYLTEITPDARAADPLVDDLAAGAIELSLVPRTREEIRWLRHLRSPDMQAWWTTARDVVDRSRSADANNLRLRDIAIVHYVATHHPSWLEMNKFDLIILLERRLDDGLTIFFNKSSRSLPVDQSSVLGHLRWGDILAALVVTELMQDPSIIETTFAQRQLDWLDRTTEYGGIIDASEGAAVMVPFEPRYREHDRKFIAPQAMMDRGYTALFHYHLHVQDEDNRDYAGPGMGDLMYADALGVNCIVFTSIDEDRLNVDYYCDGGMNLDLGLMRREPSIIAR